MSGVFAGFQMVPFAGILRRQTGDLDGDLRIGLGSKDRHDSQSRRNRGHRRRVRRRLLLCRLFAAPRCCARRCAKTRRRAFNRGQTCGAGAPVCATARARKAPSASTGSSAARGASPLSNLPEGCRRRSRCLAGRAMQGECGQGERPPRQLLEHLEAAQGLLRIRLCHSRRLVRLHAASGSGEHARCRPGASAQSLPTGEQGGGAVAILHCNGMIAAPVAMRRRISSSNRMVRSFDG